MAVNRKFYCLHLKHEYRGVAQLVERVVWDPNSLRRARATIAFTVCSFRMPIVCILSRSIASEDVYKRQDGVDDDFRSVPVDDVKWSGSQR